MMDTVAEVTAGMKKAYAEIRRSVRPILGFEFADRCRAALCDYNLVVWEQLASDILDRHVRGLAGFKGRQMLNRMILSVAEVAGDERLIVADHFSSLVLEKWSFEEVDPGPQVALLGQVTKMMRQDGLVQYEDLAASEMMMQTKLLVKQFVAASEIPAFVGEAMAGWRASLGCQTTAEVTRSIAHELMQRRRYGIKPAYFADGLLHQPRDAWVIMRNESMIHGTTRPVAQLYAGLDLAEVHLGVRDKIGGFEPTVVSPDTDPVLFTHWMTPYPVSLAVKLGSDGELYLGVYGRHCLREMFERSGKLLAYEWLQLTLLWRLWNLVVPLEVAQGRVPQLPPVGGSHGKPNQAQREAQWRRAINPDLILARLRWLERSNELDRLSDREAEEADETTRRRLRRHGVVGHIRVLPEGHKASPQARQMAAEEGITLGPSETWVTKHQRGEVGEAQIAHAVISRPSLELGLE